MQLRNRVNVDYDDEDADDYNEVDDEDVGKDDEVDDEFKDDEVEDVVEDEVKDVVKDVVGGHNEVADETVNDNKKVVSSKMVVPTGVTKPLANNGLLQYNNCKLMLKEKYLLITWHESLMMWGVTGMMVNSLEMIIKFSNEIV